MDCNCNGYSIFKGDDTGAFGNQLLRINRPSGIADDVVISKAELKCGTLPIMTFEPESGETTLSFPIDINLTATQTKQLQYTNNVYLKVYDENGLGVTCNGTVMFKANTEVI